MKAKEQLIGLTVAKDFKSYYAKLKAEREHQDRRNEGVTIYQGQVPLHQRLILLCQDFLESTWDFESNDFFNFQNSIETYDKNISRAKVLIFEDLIKELFQKYQLEIVKPNIDYFVEKY